jgi:hypothetical protein
MNPELVSLTPSLVALAGIIAAALAARRMQPARVKATRGRRR